MLPVLYQDRSFVLYTHDVFTIVGLLAGLLLYFRELRRNGMLGWPIFWIAVAAVLGGGVGARLITAWEHIDYYRLLHAVPLTYAVEHSGKSIIGGIAGGYVAIVLAKRAFGYTRSTGDAYAFAIPVGVAIGRVGCFLSDLP
jgi:prolipoprotein diacylglyceryltransferase